MHRPIQLLIGVNIIISANNLSGGPNLAVDFDTRETGTRDSDLEDASSLGNIDSYEVLGMLLMIEGKSVEFEPGGSGALRNIVCTAIPDPSVLVPFSIGLAAMGLAHRRQRKAL